MTLIIQDLLRSGEETLASVEEKYHLHAVRHKTVPNLILLKYDQIDSPMGERLVQQCRGLILDEEDNWAVVSRPFDKFFNYGESHAALIDWESARVQEKLDGSLMQLYCYSGTWQVGSSGTPDASGEVQGHPFTFADLFWKTFYTSHYKLPDDVEAVWLFELMTPYNRIVVYQESCQLKLIGIRAKDGKESWPSDLPYAIVQEFPLTNLDDVLNTFEAMNPAEQEGYVVVDKDFNRVKVKHPGYVVLHHLRSSLSPKRIVEVVRLGETGEVLAHFPEWQELFGSVQTKYEVLVEEISATYDRFKGIESQKEFALTVKHLPYSGVLFALRKGQVVSIRQALKEMQIDKLCTMLDVESQPERVGTGGGADGIVPESGVPGLVGLVDDSPRAEAVGEGQAQEVGDDV